MNNRQLFRCLSILVLVSATGCHGALSEQSHGPEAASWTDGQVGFKDLEAAVATARTKACRETRRMPGGGSIDDLLACYRETAEVLAVEHIVLSQCGQEAIETFVRENPQLRTRVFTAAWNRWVSTEIEVSEEEIETHFEAHRDEYRQPSQLTVWNIFRRHAEGADKEVTEAFLVDLKSRYEAGETFASLAREYSHSETRLRGGLVGRLSEGRLPHRLEEIALGLNDGEVSDPISVRGGAILLHVTGVVKSSEFSFDEVHERARRTVLAEKIQDRLKQRAGATAMPEDAQVYSLDEMLALIDEAFPLDAEADPNLPVLVIANQVLSAGVMRNLIGLAPGDRAASLNEDDGVRVAEIYQANVEQMLLVMSLEKSTDPADADVQREAKDNLRKIATTRVVDDLIQEEMWQLVDADQKALRQFYEDNRPHFQSELQFRVFSWDLPFDNDPPQQLALMEILRAALIAGEETLDTAAQKLGGEVRDLGMRTLSQMTDEIPAKAREYLLQVDTSGFSVPYQQDDALHLLWVEKRDEPVSQSFEEAVDKVREEYFDRYEENLYRQVAEAKLKAYQFAFNEDGVRELLSPNSTGVAES